MNPHVMWGGGIVILAGILGGFFIIADHQRRAAELEALSGPDAPRVEHLSARARAFVEHGTDNPSPFLASVRTTSLNWRSMHDDTLKIEYVDFQGDVRGMRFLHRASKDEPGVLTDATFTPRDLRWAGYGSHVVRMIFVPMAVQEGDEFSTERDVEGRLILTLPEGFQDMRMQLFDDDWNFSNEFPIAELEDFIEDLDEGRS